MRTSVYPEAKPASSLAQKIMIGNQVGHLFLLSNSYTQNIFPDKLVMYLKEITNLKSSK